MQTRQKRRILPDTMIQEIGRSVKCQKLNKFINRTPKLSVNKPKARRGDQFPGAPRWLSGYAGTFYPLTAPPAGHKFVLNPCRKAHRNYSLFPIHYSLPTRSARRNPTPQHSHPTSRDCQGIAPRRGALTSWARSLSRLRACGFGMSADFERKLLPAGAGGFPISWGYDKISAGAVGARFYTNKSGAKENHLCRELWVWPGRPLQNMI